jgi:hypothetical protein
LAYRPRHSLGHRCNDGHVCGLNAIMSNIASLVCGHLFPFPPHTRTTAAARCCCIT